MHKRRNPKTPTVPAVSADGRLIRVLSGWTESPPTENGEYWHWNGCQSCAPLPMFVLGSGSASGKCFVSQGQLGLTQAIDCDKYGGWWLKMQTPAIPDIEQCHCEVCD